MRDATLLQELISLSAERDPAAIALTCSTHAQCYGELHDDVTRFASGLLGIGIQRGERVAIYLDKCFETVVASFGAAAAGAVFVPLNPLLKPAQVSHILRDCNARVLADRLDLAAARPGDLVVVFQSGAYGASASPHGFLGHPAPIEVLV